MDKVTDVRLAAFIADCNTIRSAVGGKLNDELLSMARELQSYRRAASAGGDDDTLEAARQIVDGSREPSAMAARIFATRLLSTTQEALPQAGRLTMIDSAVVERLRLAARPWPWGKYWSSDTDKMLIEAADEIERLRKGEHICIKCGLRQDAEGSDDRPAF